MLFRSGSVDTATTAALSRSVASAGAASYAQSVTEYEKASSSPSDSDRALSKILGQAGHGVSATALFGGENGVVTQTKCVRTTGSGKNNSTPSSCQDASFTSALVDPIVRPVLDANPSATPAGKKYRLLRRLSLSQMSLSTDVLAKIHAWHTASQAVPSSLYQLWTADSMPGPAPWNDSKQVSPDSLLDAQVALRYADPNWMLTLNGKDNGYAILRAIAMNQVIGLELSRKKMKLLEYIASIDAAKFGKSTSSYYKSQLDDLYQAAQSSPSRVSK